MIALLMVESTSVLQSTATTIAMVAPALVVPAMVAPATVVSLTLTTALKRP